MSVQAHALAGIIASFVAILATVPYVVSIFAGKTKPSIATWLIWTLVSVLLASSYYASGATSSFWITISYTLSSALIATLAFRYGMMAMSYLDWACLVGALIGAIPWVFFHYAPGTLYSVLVIDAFGAVPTIKKAYTDPASESRSAWLVAFLANALNLLAVNTWNAQIGLFPLYAFFSTGLLTLLLFARPKATYSTVQSHGLYVMPPTSDVALLESLWAGLRSRVLRIFTSPASNSEQLLHVANFYKAERAEPEKEAILDTSTGLYPPAEHYLISTLQGVDTVVDLGCGNAALSRSLNVTAKTYIGIDLYISAQPSRENEYFIEGPVDGAIHIENIRRGKAVFVLINVLCYSESTEKLKDFFRINARSGDLLLLMEPTKSILWENCFKKIRLTLRSVTALREFLSTAGFDVLAQSGVVSPIWRGLGQIRISNTVIAKKR